MNDPGPTWRDFPVGMSTTKMVALADAALAEGDVIAAGNWLIHAKRLGSAGSEVKLNGLVPELERLIQAGDGDAAALLAGILLGDGSDPNRAMQLFGQAADAGVAEGKRGLGFVLLHGIGAEKDPEAANQLFLEAAGMGDGYAAFNLACNIYNGNGIARDGSEYWRWLRFASGRGIPEACALLGDSLYAQKKPEEALPWFVAAADSGHAPAMFAAASMFRDGDGTSADNVQAVRWFLTMLDRGNGDGIHEAIQLAPQMSVEEIREAGRLSGHEADAELLISRT
jgi:TPR repeat protein